MATNVRPCLDVAELFDARAHLVVEALDEAGGHAHEAVKLLLQRGHHALVTLQLAQRLHHLALVHALAELLRCGARSAEEI